MVSVLVVGREEDDAQSSGSSKLQGKGASGIEHLDFCKIIIERTLCRKSQASVSIRGGCSAAFRIGNHQSRRTRQSEKLARHKYHPSSAKLADVLKIVFR